MTLPYTTSHVIMHFQRASQTQEIHFGFLQLASWAHRNITTRRFPTILHVYPYGPRIFSSTLFAEYCSTKHPIWSKDFSWRKSFTDLSLRTRKIYVIPACSLSLEVKSIKTPWQDVFFPSKRFPTLLFFQIKLLRALRKSVKHTIICPNPGRSSSDRAQQHAITVKSSSGQFTG